MKQRRKNVNVRKIIMHSIYAVGLLSVAVCAPNAIQVLKYFDDNTRKKRSSYVVNESISGLLKSGCIVVARGEFGACYKLTKKGEGLLRRFEMQDLSIERPKAWDKKWRMLIFDIKEKRRNVRQQLRHTLVSLGFVKLQQSVWIFPYECGEVVSLLKLHYHIGKDILYIKTDLFDNDTSLRKHFDLE